MAESENGLQFGRPRRFVERAGVACLARDAKGRLIAAFQWFPMDRPEQFDRVAVRISKDDGKTWSDPQTIVVDGLPRDLLRPCDPTLVLLDDGRLRLYFTSDEHERFRSAATYSAVSSDGVHFTFEPGIRFGVEDRNVLDCAVARLGRTWHYYAPVPGTPGKGYHAVSDDGLTFRRLADVVVPGERSWLGCGIEVEGGLRFYGSGGPQGNWAAFSSDGTRWQLQDSHATKAADPGVVQTTRGTYLMLSTGPPRQDRAAPPGVRDRDTRPRPAIGLPRPPATITANDRFVYILSNGVLYQFDAQDLRLLRTTRLPDAEPAHRDRP